MSMSRVARTVSAIKANAPIQTITVRKMSAAGPPLHKVTIHDGSRGVELPGPKFPIIELLNEKPILKVGVVAFGVLATIIFFYPITQHNWRGEMGHRKSE